MAGEARGVAAPAPLPADVALVAALGIEVQPFLAGLARVRRYRAARHTIIEGECGDKLVAALVGGTGPDLARRAASLLLVGHRPRWVVSAGFCGALDPALERNDVILAREVRDEAGACYRIDVNIASEPGPPGRRITAGGLVTVDRIIRTAAEKAALRTAHSVDVVDMETAAVAALCAERGVRFLSVRVVSDTANTDLPPEVLSILGRSGGYRLGAAAGAVWRRPASVKELWALRGHAHGAAQRLAQVLPAILQALP